MSVHWIIHIILTHSFRFLGMYSSLNSAFILIYLIYSEFAHFSANHVSVVSVLQNSLWTCLQLFVLINLDFHLTSDLDLLWI